jgi:F420-non-reducing hydrogenase small subunit
MAKPKIGLYWCSSCGGCEEAVIDLAEELLNVVEAVDIVFWPVALDFKYADVEKLSDGELDCVLINGAVRMEEQEQIARLLRRKSKLVIATGSCAHLGGVVGLGNFYKGAELLDYAYKTQPSVSNSRAILPVKISGNPGSGLELSGLFNSVRPLDRVIEVDYYIPGCPPTPDLILKALKTLLEGRLPPRGSVLAEKKALCDTCPRRENKPEKIPQNRFKRVYEVEINPEKCFLEQGIICLGPVTRGGCSGRCIKGNMPCRGCFGPLDGVIDQGAKFISMISSDISAQDPEEIKQIIESIPDPAGLFYRYNLAASQLRGKK